ncbi:MAG: peptide-methionine (S)-S-oxide reductase MsrA, partial [Candidatus Aenigmatarchaeota archaeon]
GKNTEKFDNTHLENDESLKEATFAGGCFWGVEKAFEKMDGVEEVVSGYTGGDVEDPTYTQVSTGKTGHYESVRVYYDPNQTSYEQLLQKFWNYIDPWDSEGQKANRGSQYRTAIFYHDEKQRKLARRSREELERSSKNRSVATQIVPVQKFYPAEIYHQDYLIEKSDSSSCTVSYERTDKNRENLTSLQYRVTQKGETEKAFDNRYWDNERAGIYVDVVSGEPLFSSKAKFKSGSGWPSFYRPLEPENIKTRKEAGGRIEVISEEAGSHLGHVFNDGPEPTGKRYCINSAALEFIPKEKLEERGYGEYRKLFDG